MTERRYFLADDDAFGPDGIIRDGKKIRVPMTEMRDSRKPLTFNMISDGDDTSDVVRATQRAARRLARQSGNADPNGLSTSTGAPTTSLRSVPPAGAYYQAGFGVKPGDFCMLGGTGGRVVQRGDWLFCEVHKSAPPSGDAALGTRDAVDQAWRELQEEQANAWKS
jgi:hypothetical protein